MAPANVVESTLNTSDDSQLYIFHSTIAKIESVSERIVLVVYSIVLLLSTIQTFGKNKRIDHIFSYMNQAYSDGKFQSNQVCFRQQIITCYRFDQRFSYISNPNRLLLPIIATHMQVLKLIAVRTLFIRQYELVNNCFSFINPYQILQCENDRDPCRFNATENRPNCTYYYFQPTHLITTVTSVITWYYALPYLFAELVCFIRWVLFRDDDQPRRLCCCCRPTPDALRCIMYFLYIILWLCLFYIILSGFIRGSSLLGILDNSLGSMWTPIFIAGDDLCSLVLAVIPELLQNWLDRTVTDKVLLNSKSKGLLLANVEELVHLTDKKLEFPASSKIKVSPHDTVVAVEPTS